MTMRSKLRVADDMNENSRQPEMADWRFDSAVRFREPSSGKGFPRSNGPAALPLQSRHSLRESAMPTVIHCGLLIDGSGADPVRNATIVIEGDTITAVNPGGDIPRGATSLTPPA